jgi:hypothetical protein
MGIDDVRYAEDGAIADDGSERPDAMGGADGADGPVEGSVAPDAAPLDAPASDAPDGPSEGAVNLVPNPGFEQGTGACGTGWNETTASLALSNMAHTGNESCEVCLTSFASFFLDSALFDASAGSYYAEAWIRTSPEGGVPNYAQTQVWRLLDGGGSTILSAPAKVPPTATWSRSSVSVTVANASVLEIRINAGGVPEGGCILVDDVGFYAQ